MKFTRLVGAGALALLLALGAGSLTPLRADCPSGTIPYSTGWGCYVDTSGYLWCGDIQSCLPIPPWPWVVVVQTIQPTSTPAFPPQEPTAPKRSAPVPKAHVIEY